MLKRSTCSYILSLGISLAAMVCPLTGRAQATDTTATDTAGKKEAKIESRSSQLCIGADLFHPALSYYAKDRHGYELAIDYYLKKEFYGVLEGGWGDATASYPDLSYTTTNQFVRLGFNRNALSRITPNDWDIMFVGFRLGASRVSRSAASYTVNDKVWGSISGTYPGATFVPLWAEITAGMRVEFVKNFFAGWNIRGKFMLNNRSFNDLEPLYIAGYGKGDANAIFDFNVYLSYAIRWQRALTPAPPAK